MEKLQTSPLGRNENIIQGEKFRFTLLTPRLIRLEYSEDGIFEDRATQTVAPITTPQIEKLNVGKARVWLPEGTWIDFFTGMIYSGGRQLEMYRGISSIPVLAKAGAIVPMTEEIQGADAAEEIPAYDAAIVPENVSYDKKAGILSVSLPAVSVIKTVRITLKDGRMRSNPVNACIFEFLDQAEIQAEQKERIYRIATGGKSAGVKLAELQAMRAGEDLSGCVAEILTAQE